MKERTTFDGLDAQKESVSVSMLLPDQNRPLEWRCAKEAASVRKIVWKILMQAPGEVGFWHEAGPCGDALQRTLTAPCRLAGGTHFPSVVPHRS